MTTNRIARRLAAVLVFFCWFVQADRGVAAEPKVDGKKKIRELQKQRLEAATRVRDFYLQRVNKGFLPVGAADTVDFYNRLFDGIRLVHHVQLDLCDDRAERIKVVEKTIKEVEPLVAAFEKRFKEGMPNASLPYHLAQVHFLELKIELEKARQETGGK
jgi:hypothetical protein